VAPAASGKTEAVLAPLCERLLADRGGAPGIVYIVPTRALANDLELRVSSPCGAMGLRLVVRTGDRPADIAGAEADVLVTTPESLDSLLCRHAERFSGVRSVAIDEAHLLDGTARGDQMRILVRRMVAWHCKKTPQLVAMTATVADPHALGRRLLGVDVAVLKAGAPRPVTLEIVDDLKSALTALRRDGLTKAIVFCNTRRRTEEVGRLLPSLGPWPPERVMVHHASLSKREREDVEKAFRRWEAGLLVCTTTMEIGVDVGNVDAVVLVGAPDSVSSFAQRVGRGCRRRTGMRAICVPETFSDRGLFETLAQASAAGEMPDVEADPDPGVAVQQTFSILFGRPRGTPRRDLLDMLSVLGPPEDLDAIIDHLVSEGLIATASMDRLIASTTLMDMGEKGRIHSTIGDTRTVNVVDATSGRVLGKVSAKAMQGGSVNLGGRAWHVVDGGRDAISVRRGAGIDTGSLFARRPSAGPFARWLPPDLRCGWSRSIDDPDRIE
jgi:ATP-dependent Lhr-like helicase